MFFLLKWTKLNFGNQLDFYPAIYKKAETFRIIFVFLFIYKLLAAEA